ncbi:MAG: hydroxyacylglutathione hydrolase [Hyphomonadaceae bacterium]|jgi:hydroxyacylglutathione hydrolase|nr:hydroxyacylglutathione hydrolase [Hyphomonadaceae bacterium]
MATLEIHQFPCLSDNYGVLIRDAGAGLTASIDAPDAATVAAALKDKGWTLTHILTTHHHGDHTGGNAALKAQTGCTIIGPRNEAAKIPGIDTKVGEGDTFMFGAHEVRVLDTPGHTAGHITYVIPSAKVAFAGDTLFAIGCGRVIEGNAQMMWQSLKKLMALPKDTTVYCGHEYTQSNARFALTIEPENAQLQTRAEAVDQLRAAGQPTLPTTIGIELETNPFLRPHVAAIQKRLGMEGKPEWQIFGEIRERKNRA